MHIELFQLARHLVRSTPPLLDVWDGNTLPSPSSLLATLAALFPERITTVPGEGVFLRTPHSPCFPRPYHSAPQLVFTLILAYYLHPALPSLEILSSIATLLLIHTVEAAEQSNIITISDLTQGLSPSLPYKLPPTPFPHTSKRTSSHSNTGLP